AARLGRHPAARHRAARRAARDPRRRPDVPPARRERVHPRTIRVRVHRSLKMTTRQYATFEVADQLFGLDVAKVLEVLSFDTYTPVPLAPESVGGLFNLRGQVIAAVDLRVQLGLPPGRTTGPGAQPAMNIIVKTDEESAWLLRDRIGAVV